MLARFEDQLDAGELTRAAGLLLVGVVDLGALAQVQVPVAGGSYVPLSSVATIAVVDGPNQISRENGKRRVVVQANVRGRDVGSVVADAQAAIAKEVRLPAGSYLEWGGQFENLASASERLKLVVPACFVLILLLHAHVSVVAFRHHETVVAMIHEFGYPSVVCGKIYGAVHGGGDEF